jgi:hypothetical protein
MQCTMNRADLIHSRLQFLAVGFCETCAFLLARERQQADGVVHAERADLVVRHLGHLLQVILSTYNPVGMLTKGDNVFQAYK